MVITLFEDVGWPERGMLQKGIGYCGAGLKL